MLFFSKKTLFLVKKLSFYRYNPRKSSTFAAVMKNLPIVTRYLLIANFVVYFLAAVLQRYGLDLNAWCGLHYVSGGTFHWWQPVTYMFLHADLGHIFCNMFAVWMFAPMIEQQWGERRFAIYYLVCGLGAALIQELVWSMMAIPPQYLPYLNTIGASGAVFGILFAFGWLYPDVPMFILFVPIPIRARIFVILYALFELFAGLGSVAGVSADHVAHFAHLGGMLFGWLLILYWRKNEWREPKLFDWWKRLRDKSKHTRLDSSKDDRFGDYHYQKRV